MILSLALDDIGRKNDNTIADLAEHCADVINRNYTRRAKSHSAHHEQGGAKLCSLKNGDFCKALAGAIAVLYSAKGDDAAAADQDEVMDWFNSSFGGYDCDALANGIDALREELCPKIILATYLQLRNYIDPDNHISQKSLL
jgi:hypothetical protein